MNASLTYMIDGIDAAGEKIDRFVDDSGPTCATCSDPEREGDSCTISRSVPIAVMAPEPKPWSWPLDTFGGRAATLARDNPESEHYRRPEVQEDVRAWLLRTLSQLSDDARARGFEVEIEASWGDRTIHAHADLKAGQGVRPCGGQRHERPGRRLRRRHRRDVTSCATTGTTVCGTTPTL